MSKKSKKKKNIVKKQVKKKVDTPAPSIEEIRGKESFSVSYVELKRARILNLVLLVLLFLMVGISAYLFFSRDETNQVDTSEGEPVEYTQDTEFVDVQKADIYVNSREIYDTGGTFLGFKELKLELDREKEFFNMQIALPYGESVVSGSFTDDGKYLTLRFSGKDLMLAESITVRFKYIDKQNLEFVGEEFGASLPEVGDRFSLAIY